MTYATKTPATTIAAYTTGRRFFGSELTSAKEVERSFVETGDEVFAPVEVCELKGRIEFRKDQAAWALAMSRNPFVKEWSVNDGVVCSATFDMSVADKGIAQLCADLRDIQANFKELFAGRGIEIHVLVESLKLADVFDGDRNGPLSDHYA